MNTENDNKKKSDRFSYDFKNMKFTGGENALLTLLINWIFITVLVCILSFTLKEYVLPLLASYQGKRIVSSIGSIIKLFKGPRSP